MTDEAELELEKEGIWGGAVCEALRREHRDESQGKGLWVIIGWGVVPSPTHPGPHPQANRARAGGWDCPHTGHAFQLLLQHQMLGE